MDLKRELTELESEAKTLKAQHDRFLQSQREARDALLRIQGAMMQIRSLLEQENAEADQPLHAVSSD